MEDSATYQTKRRDCSHLLWLGLLGLLLLGLISYFFGNSSGKNLRKIATQTAQEALDKGNFGYAKAVVKGGLLIIEGTAPDAASKTAACEAANKAFEGKNMIGLPGIVAQIRCEITYPGEPAKEKSEPAKVASAPNDAGDNKCQSEISAAAAGGNVGFVLKGSVINSGKDMLDKVASAAAKCKTSKIEVAGHTDSGGEADMNMRLSQARADAVKAYLVSKGLSADQLVAKGYGETKPLVPDNAVPGVDSPERAKNRRIEFNVMANQ